MTTDDLLTTGAIAARWDCSKRTVEDLCRSKALRASASSPVRTARPRREH